jgi:hypothetical protein
MLKVLRSYRQVYPQLEEQVPLLMFLSDYIITAVIKSPLLDIFPDKQVEKIYIPVETEAF